MNLKCLIIEDELPAQRVLKNYIGDVPYLELCGTFKSAMDALQTIQSEDIDLLFLDINLPKISGLNFLRSLKNPPKVIITTAYPDYAHEGFELDVVDYLLKPFSFERFIQSLSKLKTETVQEGSEKAVPSRDYQHRYAFVKVDKTLHRVDFSDIKYIESDKDYVKIVRDGENLMLLQTLKHWENMLPDRNFARVHKSYIVNIARIDKIIGNQIKIGDAVIPIGRYYKQDFMDKIEPIS
ncbi:MAG: LytTR family DNA-binding domain-containing protein [Balneolaceae bacterium]|nr:LytTR family DNA-binding domain-containing protein [Balneolaceae bacterium]